ncbi:ankyrin repeat-containing domain protein [Flagelloscypha sp. PMI_526]|nr:ankyrin repeat-containing domain protein [Flagelloscypha sp. PMI_526]
MSSGASRDGLRVLTFDGSISTASAISELFIAQLIAHRWAWANDPDEREANDIPWEVKRLPVDFGYVNINFVQRFYAILFAVLNMTIGQAIRSHNILNDHLFSAEQWVREDRIASSSALESALDTIIEENQIQVDLDSPFGSKGDPSKWYGFFLVLSSNSYPSSFVCVVNDKNTTHPRILRNYRIRTSPNPRCTIRHALRATLADGTHLPPVVLQHERLVSGVPRFANVSRVLMKELPVAVPKTTHLACFVNIGSGHPDAHSVAQDLLSQYHDLGPCYFRLSLQHEVKAMDELYGHTTEYLDEVEVSTQIDCIVDTLIQRYGVISVARLGSLAGEDGKAKHAAQIEAVHEDVGNIRTNMDKDFFRYLKKWLRPIDQTAKLDENLQARGDKTCKWFLEHPTVIRWKSGPGGSCWFHGAMGTGKTVIISYLIQSLIQDELAVAYYYFDFTSSKTLSEEALFRSLVAQLSRFSEACARGMYEKHTQGAVQPQLATLLGSFCDLVSEADRPVYVIIDALDELPLPQRDSLLKRLEKAWKFLSHRLHLMITSRDEVDISERLQGKLQFELNVEDAKVQHDIALVIDEELLTEKWRLLPEKKREMVREHLKQRAGGQFRVIGCQIEVLRQARNPRDLDRALKDLPKKLEETYSYILESVPEDRRVQACTLLSVLSFAFEPVPLSEISTLIAVDLGDPADEDNLPRYCEDLVYYKSEDIIDLISAFIRTEYPWGPVHPPFLRLAHASVKEYLIQNDVHWYSINERLAHETISRACLALLLHNLTQEADSRLMVDAYVRLSWYHHIPPNGCMQLLAQQLALFHAFPWSSLRDFEFPIDAIRHVKQHDLLECPLAAAAAAGLVDLLHIMLATDIDRNTLNHALVVAAAVGAGQPVIKLLVSRGADVNALNESIGTPLQSAAAAGDLEVVQSLIRAGADVNLEGGYYDTPLNAAASEGKLQVIEFLLLKGADVNLVGGNYGTPLLAAASLGRLDAVELLVLNGADTNIVAGEYGTALQAAAYIGSLPVVKFLVGNGADLDVRGGKYGTALTAAASEGEMKVVEFLVKEGADMDIVTKVYGTALQSAACVGCLPVVEFLVVNGANMNLVGGKHGTALLAAIFEREVEVAQFLMRKGADTNLVASSLDSGRYLVLLNGNGGNLDLVRHVTAHRDTHDARNLRTMVESLFTEMIIWDQLRRPNVLPFLDTIIEHSKDWSVSPHIPSHIATVEYDLNLIKGSNAACQLTHAMPRIFNENQFTTICELHWGPLHMASYKGQLDIVKVLLKSKADPNALGQNYRTPLHLAAFMGHDSVVMALLSFAANPNIAYRDGLTPLHWATKKGYLAVVWSLLEFRANSNATGSIHGHLDVAHALLKKGADPNAANHNLRTPLHLAAKNGHLNVIELLLRSNANPYNTDKNGRTPFQLAASNGHLDIMHALMRSERHRNASLQNNPNALLLHVDQSVPHQPMKRRHKRRYEKKRF